MATNLPSCFSIHFLELLLKFLLNFALLKYVRSQRSYGFLIIKELIFGFQILDLKDHFSASLSETLFWTGARGRTPITLKAHCHPQISYGHAKFISQVHSQNVGTSVEVSYHLTGF